MSVSNNNFDAILKIAARDLVADDFELARSIDTSATVVSERTLRRVRRKIKNFDKTSWWSELPVVCRRVIAAVLIFCTISFGMCISVKAVRTEIVNTILEWYDKFVSVFYVTDITPPGTIEVYKEPLLQISDTEKQVIVQGRTSYQIIYTKGEEVIISYHQGIITDTPRDLDSEHGCIQANIEINGYSALLFMYDNGSSTITWNDNEYSYMIYAFTDEIDVNTLTLIASSIE